MADPTDAAVDSAIAHLQACLDDLKAAQRKDDAAEEPKTLREAGRQTRQRYAQDRAAARA